jgi:hypothetical protein
MDGEDILDDFTNDKEIDAGIAAPHQHILIQISTHCLKGVAALFDCSC